VLITDWHHLLSGLETDSSLMQPEQLQQRLELLDALDAAFGDFESEPFENNRNARMYPRIKAIRTRLEAINAELYHSIRSEIMHGTQPYALRRWIQRPAKREAPGLAYDYRDEVLSGILQLREPGQTNLLSANTRPPYPPPA
jgi:hypothetical protein